MKKGCLMLVLFLLAVVGLPAQVNISVEAAADVHNPGLAGKQATNPDPGGIPNGSLIDDVSTFGTSTQFIFTPPAGPAASVTIMGFTGFMVLGMQVDTGLTPSPTIMANEQVGLVDNPQYDRYTEYGGKQVGPRTVNGWDYVIAMLTGKTTYDLVQANDDYEQMRRVETYYGDRNRQIQIAEWEASHPGAGATAVNQADGAASDREAPPTVVPVVGDLGGPVDEIL